MVRLSEIEARGQHPLEATILDALYLKADLAAAERAESALSTILQERHEALAELRAAHEHADTFRTYIACTPCPECGLRDPLRIAADCPQCAQAAAVLVSAAARPETSERAVGDALTRSVVKPDASAEEADDE